MSDTLAAGRFCRRVSKAALIREHADHRIKDPAILLLTELRVRHQVSQSGSGGVGVQSCVRSGVGKGPPSRVGRG